MKKALLLGIILIISACSKSPENEEPSVPVSGVRTNWFAGVGQFNGVLDFGNITKTGNKLLTVIVKNVGDGPLSGPALVSGEGFNLAYSNCTSLAVGKSCTLKINFNSSGLANEVYFGEVSFGGSTGNLSAAVDIPVPEDELLVTVGGIPVGETGIDFGTLQYNQSVIKTLVILNQGTTTVNRPVTAPLANYSVAFNNCAHKNLSPKQSCSIKLSLSGNGKSGLVEDSLNYGDLEIPLTAYVKNLETVAEELSDVKLLVETSKVNPGPVDLGTWNLNTTKILNLYLKNEGTAVGIIQTPEIPPGVSVAYNNCQEGSLLNPKMSCLMKLVTAPSSRGTFSAPLNIQGQNYNLQSTVRSPGDKIYCPMDNALEAYITWNGVEYSQCTIEDCNSGFHLGDNTCISNQQSCSGNHGTGIQSWDSELSGYGACVLDACESEAYQLVNNICNYIPVALDQNVGVNEDTELLITLTATDLDSAVTYEIVSPPNHGDIILVENQVTYFPHSNYNGPDSFTFKAKDSTSESVPATINITVYPVNDAPLAQGQVLGVIEETGKTITLSGSDVEGSPLTYTVTQGPTGGTLTGTAPNLTFTPNYDFSGETTLKFKVNDGTVDSPEATVTLTYNLLDKDYVNARIALLESRYQAKGYGIALPRVTGPQATVADINGVSSIINALALTETTSALIGESELTTVAMNNALAKHTNIRLHCSDFTTCYARKNSYNKAVYGTKVLTVQNNFLWDAATSRYLGTQCEAWYTTGEVSWVDKKLDANKNNVWNGTYADNTTNNRYLQVFSQVAPTCGTVYYAWNQGCRSYGYAYLYFAGVQFPAGNMGNGGCSNGSGVTTVQKGDTVTISSHYYASCSIRTGY